MLSTTSLRTKTLTLVVLMVLSSAVGDVLLSKGMKQIGSVNVSSFGSLGAAFLRTVEDQTIWMGIACLLLYFVFYLVALSWADYSYVQPASASGYAIVPLLGWLVLGEVVTPMRWMGVALICAGVALIGGTPPRTTEAHETCAQP
jgi:drug/metabolite transporter (DMT)-like permease